MEGRRYLGIELRDLPTDLIRRLGSQLSVQDQTSLSFTSKGMSDILSPELVSLYKRLHKHGRVCIHLEDRNLN